MRTIVVFLMCSLFIAIQGCSRQPEPITFGTDQCVYCKMIISNPQYGAEMITQKGRILKYDAIECLINHIEEGAPEYSTLLAIAYDEPEVLHPVNILFFAVSPRYRSPMGANLAGFVDKNKIETDTSTMTLSWEQVQDRLRAQ